jgi:hypothetical protein
MDQIELTFACAMSYRFTSQMVLLLKESGGEFRKKWLRRARPGRQMELPAIHVRFGPKLLMATGPNGL